MSAMQQNFSIPGGKLQPLNPSTYCQLKEIEQTQSLHAAFRTPEGLSSAKELPCNDFVEAENSVTCELNKSDNPTCEAEN